MVMKNVAISNAVIWDAAVPTTAVRRVKVVAETCVVQVLIQEQAVAEVVALLQA